MGCAAAVSELTQEDKALLAQMRHGPISRAALADVMGLSRNTVATRLVRLQEMAWAVETEEPLSDRGRPAALYQINPLAALVFSARFDQVSISAALCALTGEVLASHAIPVQEELDPETAVGLLEQMIALMTQGHGIRRERIAMTVIGVKGPVSELARTIAWSRVGVLPIDLGARLGMPVVVENDANLMALGAAQEQGPRESVLFVLVQNGIGGGLVVNGQLHRGAGGWAGEIGHIPIAAAAGLACTCGNTGCVANIADHDAILRALGGR